MVKSPLNWGKGALNTVGSRQGGQKKQMSAESSDKDISDGVMISGGCHMKN